MLDCLINSLKEVGKCLWPEVEPHIDYWWCFDGNVKDLRDAIKSLETEMSNRNQEIEEAWRCRAERATIDVNKWLDKGSQKHKEATRILPGCVGLKVWKIIPRYSVGKRAKKTVEGIAKLLKEGNSIRIADPHPPAAMVPIARAPNLEFQSRKRMEEDIMKSLEDGNVRMIAICGAGGVGKTTMAQIIEDRVRTEELCDEVVTVVVSQQIDMSKIQKQIAEILSLDLSKVTTLVGRAHELRTRLTGSEDKLIIFDDVWERFELEKIGIPYGGCKIILTSRLKDVCEEMEADEVIEIQVLDENEAWRLFREKSGDCVDDLDLCLIAKKVAAECKGLPIALVTVGKALKDKNSKTWENALRQLRRANPRDFPKVLENVYMPLKLSYDFLEPEEKDLFLLCCLFPEDYDIQIEHLALFSFGLGLFKDINNIEDGRYRTDHLLETLKNRFLLMTGRNEEYVKMHDVVRDVAKYIGSKEKDGFLKSLEVSSEDSSRNCNWMSVDISITNSKLLNGLDFPKLRLLMILNYNYSEFSKGFDVDDICFNGMEMLTVLYFSCQNFQSLPSSLKFLKTLRKLHLDRCNVNDVSVVGELTSLEILRIWRCHDIEELPANVGKLKFLRLLELMHCKKLKRIVAGVISSLVELEELKIVYCFNKWEAKGNVSEERNASLSELDSLPKLISLEIEIFDPDLVAEELSISKQLKRYEIRFLRRHFLFCNRWKREIELYLRRDLTIGNWIRPLVKNTQSLLIDGDVSNNLNLGESLRKLIFKNCSTVEKLVNAVDCKFPVLEHLELYQLRELEEIIDGTIPEGSNSCQNLQSLNVKYLPKLRYLWKSPNQNVCLDNLKSLYIYRCHNLRYLFSMATARSLVQLQSLEILSCVTIEQVLWNEIESNPETSIVQFPTLKTLSMHDLPNLLGFTQEVEIIKLPQLTKVEIQRCPKLRTKINTSPTCMIEKLFVDDCDTIEEIFRNDGNHHMILQELRELALESLPCLTTFCRGVESIEFPTLKKLRIRNLPRLNSFVPIDSESNHDDHSINILCSKKVEMIGLKTLELRYLPNIIRKIWCGQTPMNFFHNLESLSIVKVDGIRNSISCSIAKALVNLSTLEIRYCKEMIDVIEDETDVPVNFVFPKLKQLDIRSNHKLRSFCQWKHAFELPSLEEFEMSCCPVIETFTLGSLSTPKLHCFKINYKGIGMKDLNGGIHHFISTESLLRDEIGRFETEMTNRNQKIDPAPPASMVPIFHAPTLEFQSRKSMEEDIMKSLKDGNFRMIAICGVGGVGKTTMAQRIEDRVRTEKLFDEVVTVVVSQTIDMFKIQKQMAELLSLDLSEETLVGTAHKLRNRLKDSKKKLIIFDDVWKSFELNDMGIPYGGCKIILTTRLKDVCEEMEANKVTEIQVLDENEAWTLFREKSGDCVDDLNLCSIAKKVAAECKGLPIALVTVGQALKNKHRSTWEDVLFLLTRASPTNFPEVLKNVYMPLKLSYFLLETESEQSLFLLCCLFPEDFDIWIEDLALLGFGLGLFHGNNNIEEGRNITYNLLEWLRSRFLLMTGSDKKHEVKMHDVVRDVAKYIGSEEKQGFLKSLEASNEDSSCNCNWMSVDISITNSKLLNGLDFPNLRLLMILNYNNSEFSKGFDVNDICFEGMKVLKVLYFSSQNFQSLPSSLKFLKHLRMLYLDSCEMKDVSVVGELTSLEILRILGCHDIEELPADVRKLKFLRLLELRDCKKLKRIVAGVISSLVELEELKIVSCFDKWEAKGNISEERNASLSELESLPKLISLEIDIFYPNLVAEEISLSKQLRRYQIRIQQSNVSFVVHERKILLNLCGDLTIKNWIRRLVKNTQSLLLEGDGSNNLNLGEIESLRTLIIQNCSTIEKLVNAVDCKFPMLEHLKLTNLRELEEIIDGTIPEGSNSCQNLQSLTVADLPKLRYLWNRPNQSVNLKTLHIYKCPNLRSLFSMATVRSLVQLQSLYISSCDTMKQVLWNEMESNTEASIIEFPKLKTLELSKMPNLLDFAPGVEIIEFPQLRKIKIRLCPKLRTKIDISLTCMIEEIIIDDCDTREEIFRNDGNHQFIFQELRKLELSDLPSLTTFYRGVESIKFPKLQNLKIGNLPRLNSFVAIDSEPNHDDHSIHFLCNKKVETIGLNTLELEGLSDKISKIWCRHITISFFRTLERLSIVKVDGIRNSISCSIAKALVNLNTLKIDECREMIDVIEDETHETVDSVFPNLESLYISKNCKLRSFCQWKHDFALPSLGRVEIFDCPLMKTFTLGSLSTPYLHWFYINKKGIEMKDLNGGIHHFVSTHDANEDENKEDEKHEYSAEDEKEIEGEEKTESSNKNLMSGHATRSEGERTLEAKEKECT